MKTISFAIVLGAGLFAASTAQAGWGTVTLTDLKVACYGTKKPKDLNALCDPSRGCQLFADEKMRASCTDWHNRVQKNCKSPAPTACQRATACVDARNGTDNYFASSGVDGISKIISEWSGNMNKVGTNIRTAMQDSAVIAGHKTALQQAINARKTYCGS